MPKRNLSLLLPYPEHLAVDPLINGVTADYRTVAPGHLYAAFSHTDIEDFHFDGRDYINAAVANGAAALLVEKDTQVPPLSIPVLRYENAHQAFGQIVGNFYGVQPRIMAAVTGTNGKTSTTHFVRDLWSQAGYRAASMGTLGFIAPHISFATSNGTPDPVNFHRRLALMVENHITHCVFEASSHGLDQYRIHTAKLKTAGFTNLTRDHLDYHGTMNHYRATKLKLFTEILPEGETAVINADSPEFAWYYNDIVNAGRRVVSYGHAGKDLALLDCQRMGHGQRLTISAWGSEYVVDLPLIGHFQAENALCAAGMVIAAGEPVSSVLGNLSNLASVRGRLEFVGTSATGGAVYVDYAHSTDALENVLKSLRPYTSGRLHVVFGCGGNNAGRQDRDITKRGPMGAIAAKLADHIIVTDDNPRDDDPAVIRAAIMAACPGAIEIGNRATAIATAIDALQSGDVLVIAGKGHEQGQIVGTQVLPFDDAEVARFALRNANPTSATGAA